MTAVLPTLQNTSDTPALGHDRNHEKLCSPRLKYLLVLAFSAGFHLKHPWASSTCSDDFFSSRSVKALASLWCPVKASATESSTQNAWGWVHNPMGSSSAWSAKTVNEQVVSASLEAAAWSILVLMCPAATNIDSCLFLFLTNISYPTISHFFSPSNWRKGHWWTVHYLSISTENSKLAGRHNWISSCQLCWRKTCSNLETTTAWRHALCFLKRTDPLLFLLS